MTANVRYVAYARTQRGLRSCALADGPWRKLKWLAVSDPALDIDVLLDTSGGGPERRQGPGLKGDASPDLSLLARCADSSLEPTGSTQRREPARPITCLAESSQTGRESG